MTDEQINRAIAEACGCPQCCASVPPDFCNDLNAMHQVESTLSEDQMWRMARDIERNPDRWYFRATARERAEAFLRALGKWEEVQA
jgi:hypothetical protein